MNLVTRAGPIWGMSGATLSRLSAAVSTDETWDPNDVAYLGRLFDWAKSLAGPVETPEILLAYADRPEQLVIL